jgi:predicted permease
MMPRVFEALARIQGIFIKKRLVRDFDDEWACMVEIGTDENIRFGMDPDTARREALLRMGSAEGARELHRDTCGLPLLETIGHDIRDGVRQLRRSPKFVLTAALILAIGIGANAALFSEINAVFWKTLPVQKPEQLRTIVWSSPRRAFTGHDLGPRSYTGFVDVPLVGSFSYSAYSMMRNRATGFSGLACWRGTEVNSGEWGSIEAQIVSGNYFATVGIDAALGRVILPVDDEATQSQSVAVLSYRFWQRAFGGSEGALGQRITINGSPATIVGVLPRGFFGVDPTYAPDVVLPLAMNGIVTGRPRAIEDPRDWTSCEVVGRLSPGVSEAKAQNELENLVQQAILNDPPSEPYELPQVWLKNAGQGLDSLRNATRWSFPILILIVAVVLLIACVNTAGLLFARGIGRQREFATRLALGISRGRLIRQLLTETLLIWLIGGIAGIVLAYALSPFLPRLISHFIDTPITRPPLLQFEIWPDWTVLGFSMALTILTAMIFGLAPALRASRVETVSILNKRSATPIDAQIRPFTGKVLVSAQIALAMLPLIAAGLFIHTVMNIRSVPMGFDPKGLLFFRLEPARNGYDTTRRLRLFHDLVDRLQHEPALLAASGSTTPLQVAGTRSVCFPGHIAPQGADSFVKINAVSPGVFDTWGLALLAGRDVDWADGLGKPRVAIVNEAFVRKYYPELNPLGQSFAFKCGSAQTTIVGVVADIRTVLRADAAPAVYVPYLQSTDGGRIVLTVRTTNHRSNAAALVRGIISQLDAKLPVLDDMTPIELRDRQIKRERQVTVLLILFGFVALVLSCLGVYGLIAYVVRQRRADIAVRIALGARRDAVLQMVIRESLVPALIGIVTGLVSAVVLIRSVPAIRSYLSAALFRVSMDDPWTLTGAALLLFLTASAAAVVPAWGACRMDPMATLRHD